MTLVNLAAVPADVVLRDERPEDVPARDRLLDACFGPGRRRKTSERLREGRRPADGLALVGDCIFAGSIGRTDLPGGDFQQLMRSIRERILTLPDETVLYPGHGPETTVGHERATNPFLVPNFGGSEFA